jgi:hypothetical protein
VVSVAAHEAFAELPGVLEISLEDARQGLTFLRAHGATRP